MSSYKLGKNVVKLLRDVDELEAEGERYCRDINIFLKRLHRPNDEMPSGETVGLDSMFDKIIKSIDEENVGIIGLYGMGGVGKTTLLKKVRNELGKRSGFHIIWVVVSKSPNLDGIMHVIRKSIGIGDDIWNSCSSQDEKATKIHRVLKVKKFVLLLDDMWDRLDLEKVGVPNLKETNFQSKVLFTTRFKDMCAKMKSQRKFKVEILTEKEALQLFCMKVGNETLEFNPIIPKIAEEMAKECKGLPLALSVMGSAMAGVESVEAWEHSKSNLISSSWTASGLETEVFFTLKFSYDRLADEAHKKCFLYCALYPEDYKIPMRDLIHKWMGEGFLNNDDEMRSVHDMHCHGGSIIDKLKLSCLLENVEHDFPDIDEPKVKMHDVIRDMALWITRDEDRNKKKVIVGEDVGAISQANIENWTMVERISILNGAESWIHSKNWTNLRTLLLHFEDGFEINGLQNIQCSKQLKVLELVGVSILSGEGIGGLNLLEYLSLGIHTIKNAPDFWRELENLKNLKFFHFGAYNDSVTLPSGVISNFHQLKVFSLYCQGHQDKSEEEKLVEELECLSNLEELSVRVTTVGGLNKLLKSAKLESCIHLLTLRYVMGQVNGPLLLASMSKMKHLQYLYLINLNNVIDPSICDRTCRLSMLQYVYIWCCNTIQHLTWLKYAPLLRQLDVGYCSSLEEVIKGEIIADDDEEHDIFGSLEVLMLSDLPKLRSIYGRVLSFPSLKFIKVNECENLKKLSCDSNSAKDKLILIKGEQEWWDTLEWDDSTAKSTFHSKFQAW